MCIAQLDMDTGKLYTLAVYDCFAKLLAGPPVLICLLCAHPWTEARHPCADETLDVVIRQVCRTCKLSASCWPGKLACARLHACRGMSACRGKRSRAAVQVGGC